MSGHGGWIGVDLDGTLAKYDGWVSADNIGEPVTPMLDRVKAWLAAGLEVRVFTARVSHDGSAKRLLEADKARIAITEWCKLHVGVALPVTCCKNFAMIELWDDRCVQVRPNTGEMVGHSTRGLG